MYEFIDQNTADRIKEILSTAHLEEKIKIEIDDFILNASSVSESANTAHHEPFKMEEFYLLDDNNREGVLEYKDEMHSIFINVGQWGYATRLKNTHITFGSSKFHDFCFQLELSQAVSDRKYIYIIKNITNLAGKGAICRLYRGLKNNRKEKLERQQVFIERFGHELIRLENKDWVVISKIEINELFNNSKTNKLFYNLVKDMLITMLLVESIGEKNFRIK